jgi:hypothetical protein
MVARDDWDAGGDGGVYEGVSGNLLRGECLCFGGVRFLGGVEKKEISNLKFQI